MVACTPAWQLASAEFHNITKSLQVTEASAQFLSACGRHNYVTPSSYLELLSTFRTLLEAARAENARQRKRYTIGLDKLAASAQQVRGRAG